MLDVSGRLRGTPFHDVTIIRELGAGSRCRAYLARRRQRLLVLKVYHEKAVQRHAQRFGQSVAHFEFHRNELVYQSAQAAACIAQPLGFHGRGPVQVFAQEYIDGAGFDAFCSTATPAEREQLLLQLRGIVSAAHACGIYDLDIHPANILIARSDHSAPQVKLYDFNKVPYHLAPPNPMFGWFARWGWIRPEARDIRHLHELRRRLGCWRNAMAGLGTVPVPAWLVELEPFLVLA